MSIGQKTGSPRIRTYAHRAGVSALALSLAAAVTFTALPEAVFAQSYSFNQVQIEGNERIEAGTILSYAGIARGQTVDAGELNAAYQRIVESGLFESVEITPRGNTLVIEVTEFPTVNQIAFEGNRRLKDEDLAAIVKTQSRRVYSPRQAEADAEQIAQAYVQQGRIAAQVTPKLIRRASNRVDLVFEIFEGGVTEVERIGFVGNQAYSDGRLRRVIETKQAGLLRAVIRSDTYIEDRVAFDRQLLQDFYASRGYVDFRVTGVNAELSEERDSYFLTFNVEEGQQFDFGRIGVASDLPEVNVESFRNALSLKSGRAYSPAEVDKEIIRLERLATKQGLNFVRIEPQVTRNERDLTLDVTFNLIRGPRIFVERIDIEGNTTTLDRVVRQQFDTAEGDPFNPRAIREAAERIRALGYFSDAQVEAREGSTPQQVIVDVNVTEQPTGSIGFGGSYSTTDGFGASISFAEQNFLGRGQRLSFGINTASSTQSYTFNFVEPAFLGRDVAFGLALSYKETSYDSADYDTATGIFRPSLTFPISENGRLGVRYTARYTDIIDEDDEVGNIVTAEAQEDARWDNMVGYTLSYDTRRSGLETDRGILLEFGQDFGAGGDTQFVQTDVRAIAQTMVWNDEVTLRATLQGGALNYFEGDSRVTDRYMLTESMLRGFEYAGIGPREYNEADDIDSPLGGNYYASLRLDAEFPLGLPEEYGITGGVFYDVGSVWGLSDDTIAKADGNDVLYEDFTARSSIGVSILWDSVLGPLRLNFSTPVSKEEHDNEQNFSLSLSSTF
ncbi:outer membrane protein assembly factor BamA [Salipiger sp. PrR002]|uniref:outer membrane protein assembly factor BamA n=1 Tax=Salipiger sp. PrR002 TaxID=2706489 RepID=UPI0013B6701D|nr:outer membrane protein assembly factor BamA [Salipiger sp. PrR002]NDV99266.1 outer membrane protein assembly factor BamA [Salipiger sp. PrR002]NDW55752.1 outer membrane protein assembly factor BamA [Salipiger sp. PrR004]